MMTNKDAIDWLRLLKHEDIKFDDYSEDTKELREKAIGCFQEALDLGIQALENQKTGYWIEGQTNNPKIHNILCSNCIEGYSSKGHANSQYTRERFKFCPNCGAKMKGE